LSIMNLISLLSQILGDYKEFGKGEHYFTCPFCHNTKPKFAVNVIKNAFHCWHCGAKGRSLITLFKKLDVSPSQLRELRSLLSEDQLANYVEENVEINLRLPREYTPLWIAGNNIHYSNATKYLKARGITETDIIRYQMGYAMDGPYGGRVIIPSYDHENVLNYFIARSFYDSGLKYKNPPVSKNVIMFENQINWKLPIVLVEGAFDAIAVRRNAIPLLGKFVPKKLLKMMIQKKVKDVYIALDDDAIRDAREIERTLATYDMNVKLVNLNKKDPSELGFDDTWGCIDKAERSTFKDYIGGRLQNI
jgi:DNA primase